MFGEFARLNHRAVARREDARHRHKDHADGEIPWGDDADDALRLIDNLGLRAEQAERESGPPLLALRPGGHMLLRVLERADRGHDVGHQRRSEEPTSELQSLMRLS